MLLIVSLTSAVCPINASVFVFCTLLFKYRLATGLVNANNRHVTTININICTKNGTPNSAAIAATEGTCKSCEAGEPTTLQCIIRDLSIGSLSAAAADAGLYELADVLLSMEDTNK